MSGKGPRASMRRLRSPSSRKAAGAEACLYRLIADSSADWEYLEDPDGRLLWVSPSCEPSTGHAPEDFLGDPGLLEAVVHPEDRACFAAHRREYPAASPSSEAEFRVLRPDGAIHWIAHRCQPMSLPGGTSVGRRCSNRDVTAIRLHAAQSRTEATRRKSDERYRQLFENMLEGFAFCETLFEEGRPRDFRFLVVNRAFEELTGLKDVVGKKVSEVIPGFWEAHPELFEIYGRLSRNGRPERFEIYLAPLDTWFSISAYSTEEGYFTAAFENITVRKRAEAQLRELNESLEKRVAERTVEAERRAGQLRALASELSRTEWRERQRVGRVLHENLQQILVAAKLKLDALRGDVLPEGLRPLAERVDELLAQSVAECRSLAMDMSPPVLKEAGLVGGFAWLARWMQEKHGLQMNLSTCDEWAEPADADLRAFLFEVVRELLINVVKHSGERAARVTLRRDDETFEIRVEDEGKGFDPATLREHEPEGTRFGLVVIQQRLEMMGGSMSVESAPGHGTRITLRAPSGPPAARSTAIADPPADDARKEPPGSGVDPDRPGRVRVLIADDHRIFRQGFIALLRRARAIEVVGEAADGAEAVELARTLMPDVIVMDVSMPNMNGIEATRMIAAELPGIRVVGLSMHEDEEIVASMREAGAVDFVTKGGASDAAISAILSAHFGGKKP